MIRHLTQQGVESAIMSPDAEKAFDSVRWPFLYKVLSKFGFHESTIEILKALYDKPTARVEILGQGMRQGCCASPLLFSLFIG